MSFDSLGPGDKAPDEIYVVIEIAANAGPVKYEVDKDSGLLMVDRFMKRLLYTSDAADESLPVCSFGRPSRDTN